MARHLTRLAILFLTLAAIAGCGEGYSIESAYLNILGITDERKAEVFAVVSSFLAEEGFEDFGKDEEIISLVRQGPIPEESKKQELDRLNREHTFLNRSQELRVVLSDYSNFAQSATTLSYTRPDGAFIEIAITEERPGGASPAAHHFYNRFLSALQNHFGDSVVVVNKPPPTNEAEYRRIRSANNMGAVVAWLIAFLLPFAIVTPFLVYLLRKLKVPIIARQIIFTLITAWLVTPLPFPAASILVLPAPNLLAFPWIYFDYYSKVASYAAVSFPSALLLCAAASSFLFRHRTNLTNAGT